MYGPEQHFVGGHSVTLQGPTGSPIGTFTFPADLPGSSVDQQTILVGDDGVEAAFGVKPDLIDPKFNLPARGGAACWEGIDCVAWGNFSGTTSPTSGIPADPPGVPDGLALRRSITGGICANRLDGADDRHESELDFADAAPSPQSFATIPPPIEDCTSPLPTPEALIEKKPMNPTNVTSAAFTFGASPTADDFECRLDLGAYADCDSGAASYGSLAEGTHTFRVRGSNANGIGAPAIYDWSVDLTAPTANITKHPIDPSSGKSASFTYSSDESSSKFECKLEPPAATFGPCDAQPNVFLDLPDGKYKFEVRAIDKAGNVQADATEFSWTVNNLLEDETPPETTIDSKPPDPSSSSAASFSYHSSEPGSSFECKLDEESFSSCEASGISYSSLTDGLHSFQVRAIDASKNIDPTPAGYSFTVAVPVPVQPLAPAATPLSIAPASGPISAPAPVPNTTIAKQATRTRDRTPTFRFSSSKGGASFQCKLDGGAFRGCRSPFTTKKLGFGPHTLQVRAVASGATDPTPAKFNFKIVKG